MIGPTYLLHPSPAPHFKTFQVFLTFRYICDKKNIISFSFNPVYLDYKTNLGAFAKFQQASSSFIMPVCLSVRQHGTTQDLHEILYLSIFFKICQENSSLIKIWQITGTLHEGLCTFMISHSVLLRMSKFQTKLEEKIITQILCSVTFFRKYGRARQATDNNVAHMHCMLDK